MDKQIDVDIIQRHAPEAAKLLKVVSHETRLLILCNLCRGEKSVSELAKILGLSQSNLSQHLARLRRRKMLKTRSEGTTVFYSPAEHPVQELLRALSHIIGH